MYLGMGEYISIFDVTYERSKMTEPRKVIRDGKVGVIIGKNTKWFTRDNLEEIIFLPEVINYLENISPSERNIESAITLLKQCPEFESTLAEYYSDDEHEDLYYEYAKAMTEVNLTDRESALEVEWVEEGSKVCILPFPLGGEYILLYEEIPFIDI